MTTTVAQVVTQELERTPEVAAVSRRTAEGGLGTVSLALSAHSAGVAQRTSGAAGAAPPHSPGGVGRLTPDARVLLEAIHRRRQGPCQCGVWAQWDYRMDHQSRTLLKVCSLCGCQEGRCTHQERVRVTEPYFQGAFAAPAEADDGPEPEAQYDAAPSLDKRQLRLYPHCPSVALFGVDVQDATGEALHYHAKAVICGREWCASDPGCGGKDGKAHQRRKARWFPKARQMRSMGYLVATIPPELRDDFRAPDLLSKAQTAAGRMMKRCGWHRGLQRLHWFGEALEGMGGDPGHGERPDYHPHVNLLVDGGQWIPEACEGEDKATGRGCQCFRVERTRNGHPKQVWTGVRCLASLKRSWRNILSGLVGRPVAYERINLYWQYAQEGDVGKMAHWVSYVTRPTFLNAHWDETLAYETVLGYRNMRSWGKWKDAAVWSVPPAEMDAALLAYGEGRCPLCGREIRWHGLVSAAVVELVGGSWQHEGGGFYVWTGASPPPVMDWGLVPLSEWVGKTSEDLQRAIRHEQWWWFSCKAGRIVEQEARREEDAKERQHYLYD